MAKRRTLKQKQKARHSFTISWEPGSSRLKNEPGVNRQLPESPGLASAEPETSKIAKITAKELDIKGIKKNMFLSLTYAALILSTEIVLYFIWNVK